MSSSGRGVRSGSVVVVAATCHFAAAIEVDANLVSGRRIAHRRRDGLRRVAALPRPRAVPLMRAESACADRVRFDSRGRNVHGGSAVVPRFSPLPPRRLA
jgi:hypothetical protein